MSNRIDFFKTIFECAPEEKAARIRNLHPADRVSYYRWLKSMAARTRLVSGPQTQSTTNAQ